MDRTFSSISSKAAIKISVIFFNVFPSFLLAHIKKQPILPAPQTAVSRNCQLLLLKEALKNENALGCSVSPKA